MRRSAALLFVVVAQAVFSASAGDICRCEPDLSWRINEVTVRGTHNSYHIRHRDRPSIPDWWYTHVSLTDQLEKFGVRQFEITIQPPVDGILDFEVAHVPIYDEASNCGTLRQCLQEAYDWAHAPQTQTFTPLYFIIESKFVLSLDEWDLVDDIINGIWREDVIKPDDLRIPGFSLQESILPSFGGGGWPTLRDTQGKAFFIVADKWEEYVVPDLRGRTSFVYGPAEANYTVFRKVDNPLQQPALDNAVRDGFIIRTRSDADFVEQIDTLDDDSIMRYFFLVMDLAREEQVTVEDLKEFFDAVNAGLPDLVYEQILPLLFEACGVENEVLNFEQFECVNELLALIDVDVTTIPKHEDYSTLTQTFGRREAARRSGAHHISTDYLVPTGQGHGEFYYVLDPAAPDPFGTIAICNPVFHTEKEFCP